ncbi:MAG: autotransporter-associated beta strand repeat-containing protein, partial [Verrucomicrobiae bacterium]|nr:autotransporter-associated beta strand repeat-containing protein [Verrucomicrobiae bacterium]
GYTETPSELEWDTDTGTADAQGGSGNWTEGSGNLWWDGAANTVWPASGSAAVFGGTAGTVTVDAGGVTAPLMSFLTDGYTVDGGVIDLGSDSALISGTTGITTTINAGLSGSAKVSLTSGTAAFILGGANTSLSGDVTQSCRYLGITNDDALGSGTYQLGNGGNSYISALDGDRTLANNVVFAGNRIIIHDGDLGSGLGTGALTIDGDLSLNCISPGDLYLKHPLTLNGTVSGNNNGIGLLLAGDADTLALNGVNTFTGGLTWATSSIVEVPDDAALGDVSNTLSFNAGSGTLRAMGSFTSARAIQINGMTSAVIDTNGSDLELTGTITGNATSPAMTTLQKIGAGTLTLSGAGSNLSGGVRVDEGILDFTGGSIGATQWNGLYGVGGGARLNILGGSFGTQTYYSVGNSVNDSVEAVLEVNGGSFNCGLEFLVGQKGKGRFVMTSGTANLNQLSFGDGPDASRTAVMELNGGTVAMRRTNRRTGSAIATIRFNGSTIVAREDQADFLRGSGPDTTYTVETGGAIFDTDGFNIGILEPLAAGSPSGGVTKNGAGALSLEGINTYTGDTVVNGGTLIVSGDSLPDTGKLVINSGGVVEVTTDETVDTLFFGGVQQAAGTYGSTSSTATFQDDTRFSGTEMLIVTSGTAASDYDTWHTGFTFAPGADTTPGGDADNDSMLNRDEYAFGLEPDSGSSVNPIVVPFNKSTGLFSYTRRKPSLTGLSYSYRYSTTLDGAWTLFTPDSTSSDSGDPVETIEVDVPDALLSNPRLFIRVEAQ